VTFEIKANTEFQNGQGKDEKQMDEGNIGMME
jgi:hypothetical protein